MNPGKTLAVLFLTIGASFVPIGILDHLLLVKLMREGRPDSAAAPGRTPE